MAESPIELTTNTLRERGIVQPPPPKPEASEPVASEPEAPKPVEKPLATIDSRIVLLILVGLVALAVVYHLVGWLLFSQPSTFPGSMYKFPENEARLVARIRGRDISRQEILDGVLMDGVRLADMERTMAAEVDYNHGLVVVPINYGAQHAYKAIGFYTDKPIVLLNPYISTSSGLVTVTQKPNFCLTTRDYQLPPHVVIAGSFPNSTTTTQIDLEGAQAAFVYTTVHQLTDTDVCDPLWN